MGKLTSRKFRTLWAIWSSITTNLVPVCANFGNEAVGFIIFIKGIFTRKVRRQLTFDDMIDTIFQRKPYDVKYYMVKIQILQYKKLYRWLFDYYMTNFYNIMEYEILLDDSLIITRQIFTIQWNMRYYDDDYGTNFKTLNDNWGILIWSTKWKPDHT